MCFIKRKKKQNIPLAELTPPTKPAPPISDNAVSVVWIENDVCFYEVVERSKGVYSFRVRLLVFVDGDEWSDSCYYWDTIQDGHVHFFDTPKKAALAAEQIAKDGLMNQEGYRR
jgi:hypothetical protein